MLFLWRINFELCYRKLIRFAAIWDVFNGIGVDGVGVNLFFFFCFSVVFAFCLCFCALSFFFGCFGFVFCLFSFFPLIFVSFPRFSLFFFVFCIFVSFYSFQEIWVFSAHFQAAAVDCPSVFGYGKTAKTRKKKEFRSDPVYTDSVRNFPSDAPFQDSDPMKKALGWPMIRERIPLRQATGPLQKKIPQKYFDVMLAPIIA